jgi:hypothetical protein
MRVRALAVFKLPFAPWTGQGSGLDCRIALARTCWSWLLAGDVRKDRREKREKISKRLCLSARGLLEGISNFRYSLVSPTQNGSKMVELVAIIIFNDFMVCASRQLVKTLAEPYSGLTHPPGKGHVSLIF